MLLIVANLLIHLKRERLRIKSASSWCRYDPIKEFGTLISMKMSVTNVKKVRRLVVVGRSQSMFLGLTQTPPSATLTAESKSSWRW
jgi:hypothetical protein